MSREEKIGLLRGHLERLERQLHSFPELADRVEGSKWDLCFEVPTGLAFLRLVEPEESLDHVWYHTQVAISRLRDARYDDERRWLPDLYLVLILENPEETNGQSAQAIVQDPYICRKIILAWDDRMESLFEQMPFWPMQLPHEHLQIVPPLADVMGNLGYSRAFVDALPSTGESNLVEQLLDGSLKIKSDESDGTEASDTLSDARGQMPTQRHSGVVSNADRLHIQGLEVEGFRAFSQRRHFDLHGDLVVVYAPNGTGKTSLCEALEWGLTGAVLRLPKPCADAADPSRNPLLHAESDHANVVLKQLVGTREQMVEASAGVGKTDMRWGFRGESGGTLQATILRTLGAHLPDDRSAAWIRQAFRRYHFLPQHEPEILRDKPSDRYDMVQALIGTMEYQKAAERVERVRKLLEQLINERERDVATEDSSLKELEQELTESQKPVEQHMTDLTAQDPEQILADTCRKATALGLSPKSPDPVSPDALHAFLSELLAQVIPDTESDLQAIADLPRKVAERSILKERISALKANEHAFRGERSNLENRLKAQMSEVETLIEQVKSLRDQHATKSRHVARLRRHLELQSGLASSLEEVTRLAVEAATKQGAVDEAAATVKRAMEPHTDGRAMLQSVIAKLETLEARLRQIEAARLALSDHRASEQLLVELEKAAEGPTAERQEVARDLNDITDHEKELRANIDKAQVEIARLEQSLSTRQRLLTELRSHIDSEHCPLCRTRFESQKALAEAILASLDEIPPGLTETRDRRQKLTESLQRVQDRSMGMKRRRMELDLQLTAIAEQRAQVLHRIKETERLVRDELCEVPLDGAEDDLDLRIRTVRTELAAEQARRQKLESEVNQLASILFGAQASLADRQVEQRKVGMLLRQATQTRDSVQAEIRSLQLADADMAEAAKLVGELSGLLDELASRVTAATSAVREGKEAIKLTEEDIETLDRKLQQNSREQDEILATVSALRHSLQQLGLAPEADVGEVISVQETLAERLTSLRELRGRLPLIRTYAELLAARQRLTHVEASLAAKRATIESLHGRLKFLVALQTACQQFLGDLHRERKRLELERQEGLNPLFKHIYRRLSTHPYFGEVELVLDTEREELKIQVTRRGEQVPFGGVPDYFSEAQMNVVRLSVFLTQALLQGWSALDTIIMDDPVQHLDDMNTYSLLDLLLNLSQVGRQIIVTTSDRRLYKMMLVKYAALNRQGGTRFRAYRMRGIGGDGPLVIEDTNRVRLTDTAI